jgi:hypothetical protein
MDLKEIGCEVVDLMHLGRDRDQRWDFENEVMNFFYYIKGTKFLD